ALGGCYFSKKIDDRSFNPTAVAQIQVGKTTKAEVLQLLGPPREIIRLLESEAYMYVHSIEKNTGTFLLLVNLNRTDKQYDSVAVIINRQDVVTAVGSRASAQTAAYGFPWE
ncbi:MAG TPA: outer membrane protein assembly factor BamE, partial [Planctomycetota bacterium]|nr:outer membrane protein assembly factor BamE [Planctomycetota bacterium]